MFVHCQYDGSHVNYAVNLYVTSVLRYNNTCRTDHEETCIWASLKEDFLDLELQARATEGS